MPETLILSVIFLLSWSDFHNDADFLLHTGMKLYTGIHEYNRIFWVEN